MNTFEESKRLASGGFTTEQSDTLASVFYDAVEKIRAEMKADMQAMKSDIRWFVSIVVVIASIVSPLLLTLLSKVFDQ